MTLTIHDLKNFLNVDVNIVKGALQQLNDNGTISDRVNDFDSELLTAHARKYFESLGYRYPHKNIAFYANKGGVGKTSVAINMAYRAAEYGAKVLFVDLDMQANATNTIWGQIPDKTFIDVLQGKALVQDLIVRISDNLDLLPSSLANARLEIELTGKRIDHLTYYKRLFQDVRDNYDLLVMDLAPSLSLVSYLAVLYSDEVYLPATPDIYSAQGVGITMSTIDEIRETYPDKQLETFLVWNRYNASETNSLGFITDMKEYSGLKVAPVLIRSDASIKNAEAEGKTVFQCKKRTKAYDDLDVLTQHMMGLNDFFQHAKKVVQ